MNDAIVADTPEKIQAFGLLALKGALKMESIGMKRRGESAFSQAKRITGLKARTAVELLPLYVQWLKEQGILPVS
jgi:hypothetical protein